MGGKILGINGGFGELGTGGGGSTILTSAGLRDCGGCVCSLKAWATSMTVARLPVLGIRTCLEEAGAGLSSCEVVVDSGDTLNGSCC